MHRYRKHTWAMIDTKAGNAPTLLLLSLVLACGAGAAPAALAQATAAAPAPATASAPLPAYVAELETLDHPWVQEYFNGPRGRAAREAT